MGRLHELIRLHIKLKPRLTRQLHLGIEKQSFAGFYISHLPKVESITDAQFLVQPSPSIESVSTHKFVHNPANSPEKVVLKPTIGTADGTGGLENILLTFSIFKRNNSDIPQDSSCRIIEILDVASLLAGAVTPPAENLILLKFPHCRSNRLFKEKRAYFRIQLRRIIVLQYGFTFKPLNESGSKFIGDRGEENQPVG